MITELRTDMNDLAFLFLELKSISVMTVIHSIVEKLFPFSRCFCWTLPLSRGVILAATMILARNIWSQLLLSIV